MLLVSPLPPPPGGIQTWTEVLLERGTPPPFKFEIVDTRVTRRHQDIPPRLNRTEIKRFLVILRGIRDHLRSGRFSIMHLNCSLTKTATPRNLLSTLVARRSRVPYIVHLRGTFDPPTGTDVPSRLYRVAYRTMFEGAAAIIALGEPSHRGVLRLGAFGEKTTRLLPNFVDFRAVPSHAPEAKGHRVPLRVISTGGLSEAKGTLTILAVAEHLKDLRFEIVGDGPPESRAALDRLIGQRGLADRVEIRGPVTHREVPALLGASDVFLFPSRTEGFPNSVSEAMAVGLPVVASPVGAIPEMIDVPQGGFLVEPDDLMGYVEALSRLRDQPELRERMGRHNRAKAEREYDYDVVVARLCATYRMALETR